MLRTKVSSKGQVTLPKSVRTELGIAKGSELAVTVRQGAILLEKVEPRWRHLRGSLAGSGLVQQLEREHREEIEHDEARVSDL